MSGNNNIQYKPVQIVYPKFYINPNFSEIKSLEKKTIKWNLVTTFKVVSKNPEWDSITISIRLSLYREYDAAKISELVTESTYEIETGATFEQKYYIIGKLINQTSAHAQGAWAVKHSNPVLLSEIPQTYNKYLSEETGLKKDIYEKWQ